MAAADTWPADFTPWPNSGQQRLTSPMRDRQSPLLRHSAVSIRHASATSSKPSTTSAATTACTSSTKNSSKECTTSKTAFVSKSSVCEKGNTVQRQTTSDTVESGAINDSSSLTSNDVGNAMTSDDDYVIQGQNVIGWDIEEKDGVVSNAENDDVDCVSRTTTPSMFDEGEYDTFGSDSGLPGNQNWFPSNGKSVSGNYSVSSNKQELWTNAGQIQQLAQQHQTTSQSRRHRRRPNRSQPRSVPDLQRDLASDLQRDLATDPKQSSDKIYNQDSGVDSVSSPSSSSNQDDVVTMETVRPQSAPPSSCDFTSKDSTLALIQLSEDSRLFKLFHVLHAKCATLSLKPFGPWCSKPSSKRGGKNGRNGTGSSLISPRGGKESTSGKDFKLDRPTQASSSKVVSSSSRTTSNNSSGGGETGGVNSNVKSSYSSDAFNRLTGQCPPYVFRHRNDAKSYMSEYRERYTVGNVCRKARKAPVLGVDVPDPYACKKKKKTCTGIPVVYDYDLGVLVDSEIGNDDCVCIECSPLASKMALQSTPREGATPGTQTSFNRAWKDYEKRECSRAVPNLAPVREKKEKEKEKKDEKKDEKKGEKETEKSEKDSPEEDPSHSSTPNSKEEGHKLQQQPQQQLPPPPPPEQDEKQQQTPQLSTASSQTTLVISNIPSLLPSILLQQETKRLALIGQSSINGPMGKHNANLVISGLSQRKNKKAVKESGGYVLKKPKPKKGAVKLKYTNRTTDGASEVRSEVSTLSGSSSRSREVKDKQSEVTPANIGALTRKDGGYGGVRVSDRERGGGGGRRGGRGKDSGGAEPVAVAVPIIKRSNAGNNEDKTSKNEDWLPGIGSRDAVNDDLLQRELTFNTRYISFTLAQKIYENKRPSLPAAASGETRINWRIPAENTRPGGGKDRRESRSRSVDFMQGQKLAKEFKGNVNVKTSQTIESGGMKLRVMSVDDLQSKLNLLDDKNNIHKTSRPNNTKQAKFPSIHNPRSASDNSRPFHDLEIEDDDDEKSSVRYHKRGTHKPVAFFVTESRDDEEPRKEMAQTKDSAVSNKDKGKVKNSKETDPDPSATPETGAKAGRKHNENQNIVVFPTAAGTGTRGRATQAKMVVEDKKSVFLNKHNEFAPRHMRGRNTSMKISQRNSDSAKTRLGSADTPTPDLESIGVRGRTLLDLDLSPTRKSALDLLPSGDSALDGNGNLDTQTLRKDVGDLSLSRSRTLDLSPTRNSALGLSQRKNNALDFSSSSNGVIDFSSRRNEKMSRKNNVDTVGLEPLRNGVSHDASTLTYKPWEDDVSRTRRGEEGWAETQLRIDLPTSPHSGNDENKVTQWLNQDKPARRREATGLSLLQSTWNVETSSMAAKSKDKVTRPPEPTRVVVGPFTDRGMTNLSCGNPAATNSLFITGEAPDGGDI